MNAAAGRRALVPALILCAALTAAPDAARADGEPLVLFPGAAVEDRQESVPEASQEAAPDAPTGPGGPAAVATPSDSATPQGREQDAQDRQGPAGGSRLLRALAETAKAPASPDDGVAGATGAVPLSGPRVFAAEGCPRALLRRLLAGAAGEADALSALGIEREILTLCRERQEILVGLFETEAALRELSAPVATAAPPPQPAAITSTPAEPAPRTRTAPAVQPAAPSPLRAALTASAEKANEADTRAGDTRAGEPEAPRYAWFSIIGTAGALRAGVTDGAGVWFVGEGDPLPGGARIAAIAGRPPAVRITGAGEGGEAIPLPYRARPGAVR